ncbi:MAG: hypothetical protein ACFFDI_14195, partial [Promethearchaeota archaeon]
GRYKLSVTASGYKDEETEWFEVRTRTIEKNIELSTVSDYWKYGLYGLYALPVLVLGLGIITYIIIKNKKSGNPKVFEGDVKQEKAS